jgi:hypothetical protein
MRKQELNREERKTEIAAADVDLEQRLTQENLRGAGPSEWPDSSNSRDKI